MPSRCRPRKKCRRRRRRWSPQKAAPSCRPAPQRSTCPCKHSPNPQTMGPQARPAEAATMTQPRAAGGRTLRFTKMHGAGNDFVVVDLRHGQPAPDAALCRALADRNKGVGCDQILTIEAPRTPGAAASYRIWNADGSQAQQCGNGARCVAAWLVRDGAAQGPRFVLDSPAGTHAVDVLRDGRYRIAMGVPAFDPA